MESNPDLKKGSDEEEEVFDVPPEMGQTPTQLTRDDRAASLTVQKSSDVLNVPSQETPSAPEASTSRSRSKSPTQRTYTQSAELEYRLTMQASRASLIDGGCRQINALTPETTTIARVNAKIQTLTDLWNSMREEHERFATLCSPTFLRHPYMKACTFEKVHETYAAAMEHLLELQHHLTRPAEPARPPPAHAPHSSSISLPKVDLPKFDGSYSLWYTFKDLFTSLIIQNRSLTDVERMHYLKSTLKGEAAQVTINLSVETDAFQDAWAALVKRYENRRLLMSTHLDKLTSLSNCSRTAQSLNSSILAVNQSLDALRHMGCAVQW